MPHQDTLDIFTDAVFQLTQDNHNRPTCIRLWKYISPGLGNFRFLGCIGLFLKIIEDEYVNAVIQLLLCFVPEPDRILLECEKLCYFVYDHECVRSVEAVGDEIVGTTVF